MSHISDFKSHSLRCKVNCTMKWHITTTVIGGQSGSAEGIVRRFDDEDLGVRVGVVSKVRMGEVVDGLVT